MENLRASVGQRLHFVVTKGVNMSRRRRNLGSVPDTVYIGTNLSIRGIQRSR